MKIRLIRSRLVSRFRIGVLFLCQNADPCFSLSRHSNDRLALKGTAYECAKAITRSAFCIEFEGELFLFL